MGKTSASFQCLFSGRALCRPIAAVRPDEQPEDPGQKPPTQQAATVWATVVAQTVADDDPALVLGPRPIAPVSRILVLSLITASHDEAEYQDPAYW